MPRDDCIDLDAVDVDELRVAKRRKMSRRETEAEARVVDTAEEDNRIFREKIEERRRRLRDRSLSPGYDAEKELRARRMNQEGIRPPTSPVRRTRSPPRGGARGDDAPSENAPKTKIEQQLERAQLQKERVLAQQKQYEQQMKAPGGRRLGGIRRREMMMMNNTGVHWSDKALRKMNERDWRIFKEDFEIQLLGGGSSCPLPMRNWEEGYDENIIAPKIMDAIRAAGYKHPSPVQMACIPIGIRRLDLIGLAETGSGKTAAFVIPMVHYVSEQPPMTPHNAEDGPYAIIMCPSRELARQIETECYQFGKPFGFNTYSVVGGTSMEEQAHELRKGVQIVVGTPGRLVDLLERRYVVFNQCNYVILDEADSMVKEGMEQQVTAVLDHMPSSNTKPMEMDEEDPRKTYRVTVMFSSTMAPRLQMIAQKHLRRPVQIKIGLSSPSDIKQTILMINDPSEKKSRIVQELRACLNSPVAQPVVIIFCNERGTVENLTTILIEEDFKVDCIHGGLDQYGRERVMNDFHERTFNVLVGTDLVGRGIDVKGVTHVINYDMPTGTSATENPIDKYSQRIGRTGRAGMKGDAISFVCPKTDEAIMYALKEKLEAEGQDVPGKLAAEEAARIAPNQLAFKRKRDTVLYCK
eukprot:TRINITY_DN27217_c0_g1_i1.p1 TRINITY_DN27217_c0_g1~~TRINITY_DN27217_c0_g1_i1.p1  ORF type:complete len:638 (+),score=209.20 TRINITY_DN27217_c0_g1_i1:100-2013(+)